jgi:hypothetical protein
MAANKKHGNFAVLNTRANIKNDKIRF